MDGIGGRVNNTLPSCRGIDTLVESMYNTYIQTQKERTMEAFKSWEEMTTLEQYACQFWDMYKDAYGVRPRGIDTTEWTLEQFEAEFVQLGKTIEANYKEQLASEARAIEAFEDRVAILLGMGADDREQALLWIHEAEGSNGDDEYLCFLMGLPYRYFVKETV